MFQSQTCVVVPVPGGIDEMADRASLCVLVLRLAKDRQLCGAPDLVGVIESEVGDDANVGERLSQFLTAQPA